MHLLLLLSIALSTLATADPLPTSTTNALEARAPTASTQEGKLIELLKPRSIHNASPTDDKKENAAVVLPKRGFWDDVGDDARDGIVDYLNDMACHDAALADDPCQKKKSRSIHDDASHTDDEEEKSAAVLPKRGLWDLTDEPCKKKSRSFDDDASHTDDE